MIVQCKKKPMIVQAIRFTGTNGTFIKEWSNDQVYLHESKNVLVVRTLEGKVEAIPGSFIIKGFKNEVWPIREDIFNETYEILGDINEMS